MVCNPSDLECRRWEFADDAGLGGRGGSGLPRAEVDLDPLRHHLLTVIVVVVVRDHLVLYDGDPLLHSGGGRGRRLPRLRGAVLAAVRGHGYRGGRGRLVVGGHFEFGAAPLPFLPEEAAFSLSCSHSPSRHSHSVGRYSMCWLL